MRLLRQAGMEGIWDRKAMAMVAAYVIELEESGRVARLPEGCGQGNATLLRRTYHDPISSN